MTDIQALKDRLQKLLPRDRYEHSLRVMECAEELAGLHKADKEKARLAGLLHDCSRFLEPPDMLKKAEEFGYSIGPIERSQPKLLHAALSADLARIDHGVDDEPVIRAIRNHTVGEEKMDLLSKIVFLADHIEAERDYPGVDKVRSTAKKDLSRAIVESTNEMIKHLIDSGLPIFEGTIRTRNYYLNHAE